MPMKSDHIKSFIALSISAAAMISGLFPSHPDSGAALAKKTKTKIDREQAAIDLAQKTGMLEQHMTSDAVDRLYYVHLPPNFQEGMHLPMVMMFHGGADLAIPMERLTGINQLADQAGFIVVYPIAVDRYWNDGRNVENVNKFNDIMFVNDLIGHMERRWGVDPTRIYAAGYSNGGFFAQYLALHLPDKIAAICSVAAGLPNLTLSARRPVKPISVMYVLGRQDPLMPFNGGFLNKLFHDRGSIAPASEAAKYWVTANACTPSPTVSVDMPDVDQNDGTRVKFAQFSGGKRNTEVAIFGIDGGGHTWPGSTANAPVNVVGNTSNDINATQLMWEFFQRHSTIR